MPRWDQDNRDFLLVPGRREKFRKRRRTINDPLPKYFHYRENLSIWEDLRENVDEQREEKAWESPALTLHFAFFCRSHFQNFLHDKLFFLQIRIFIRTWLCFRRFFRGFFFDALVRWTTHSDCDWTSMRVERVEDLKEIMVKDKKDEKTRDVQSS